MKESKFPSKNVELGNSRYTLFGLSEDDPYFKILSDGFEPEFTMVCEHLLSDDSICFDIGANIGAKSLTMANMAKNGKIISVEASPSVAELLRLNISSNNITNIFVEEMAIGDSEKMVHFTDSSCFGHIDVTGKSDVSVEMTTINQLSIKHNLPRVDFVKIDIEGNEPRALQCSEEFFKKYDPVVYVEFNSWCQMTMADWNPKQFLDWIFDAFSTVYSVSKGDRKLLLPITREKKNDFLWRNIQRDGFVTDLLLSNNPIHYEILNHLAQIDIRPESFPDDVFIGDYQGKLAEREDVIAAYRLILGREPENIHVVDGRVEARISIHDLRNEMLNSEEFLRSK